MGAALAEQPVEPKKTLDSFRAQSGRFLFAQPRCGGDLVYLEQGTAHQRRTETREQLMCPVPGCTSPEITTVSRSRTGARDGYRHLIRPDTRHAAESAFHRQAKALVARWARSHPAVASAEEEARVGDGERVADVLLTSRTGNRIAVEIQYAALSYEQWAARSVSYQRLGIAVTWMWGHVGSQSPLRDRWRSIAGEMVDHARPVLWINPAEEWLAWAYDLGALHDPPRTRANPEYQFGRFDDLEIRRSGLLPRAFLDDCRRVREEVDAAARRREQAEAARAARLAEMRRRQALRAPQAALTMVPSDPRTGSAWTEPNERTGLCPRCGFRLDPSLSVHADPFCDRWR